ncbi:hypothetical protein C0J52_23643, partial [Blattella germanica]
ECNQKFLKKYANLIESKIDSDIDYQASAEIITSSMTSKMVLDKTTQFPEENPNFIPSKIFKDTSTQTDTQISPSSEISKNASESTETFSEESTNLVASKIDPDVPTQSNSNHDEGYCGNRSNPSKEAQDVIEGNEEPAAEVEEPVAEVEEPVAEVEEPVAEVEEPEPVAEVEEPVAEVEEPVAEVEDPVAEVEEPAIGAVGGDEEKDKIVDESELARKGIKLTATAGDEEEVPSGSDRIPLNKKQGGTPPRIPMRPNPVMFYVPASMVQPRGGLPCHFRIFGRGSDLMFPRVENQTRDEGTSEESGKDVGDEASGEYKVLEDIEPTQKRVLEGSQCVNPIGDGQNQESRADISGECKVLGDIEPTQHDVLEGSQCVNPIGDGQTRESIAYAINRMQTVHNQILEELQESQAIIQGFATLVNNINLNAEENDTENEENDTENEESKDPTGTKPCNPPNVERKIEKGLGYNRRNQSKIRKDYNRARCQLVFVIIVMSQVKYILEQRMFLSETYTRKHSYLKCRIRFIRKFLCVSVPIHRIVCICRQETESQKNRPYRRKLDDIGACFEQSPHKSLSKLAQQVGVSVSSVWNATKLLKYKIGSIHKLFETD